MQLDMPTAMSLFSTFPSTQVSLPDAHEAVGDPDVFFVPCQVLNSQLKYILVSHAVTMESNCLGRPFVLLVSTCYLVVRSA